MIKANSIKKIAAVALAAQLLLPGMVFAAAPRGAAIDPQATDVLDPTIDGSAGFCARVTALIPQMTARFAERKANLEARRAEQKGKRTAARAAQSGRLGEIRAKEDGVRSSTMIKLNARAKTTAQKAAVAKFKASMDAAVTARRAAMNAAQNAFQTSLDGAIAGRKEVDIATIAAYENAITTALNKAKADCVGRIRETIVRDRLRAAFQTARQEFLTGRSQLESQEPQVQYYIDVRRTAVQKAFDEFKTKAETARDELKAAFAAEAGSGVK